MEQVIYCLMCLGTEKKMYAMNSSMLTIYNELILSRKKLSIKHMHACYECAYLLHKYGQFKMKCCKAYNILWSLSPGSFEVTEDDLKSIDRTKNKLESLLTICNLTVYHQPRRLNNSVKRINAQKVEKEKSINSMQEQCSINRFDSQEKLASPITVTTTYNDDDQLEMHTEIQSDMKSSSECDIEDCYQSEDMLDAGSSACISNEESDLRLSAYAAKQDLDIESIEICDIMVDLSSPVKLGVKCLDNDHFFIISDKYIEKINTINNQGNVQDKRKRNLVTQNENDILGNEIIKTNEYKRNKGFSEDLVVVSMEENKPVAKKKVRKNRSTEILLNNKDDRRITLNSSFFRDYVNVIKMSPEDARSELLLRKESRNFKMNTHKCNLCYRGFISENTYDAHMKKHSLEYGAIKCDICQLSFSDGRSLSRHWSMCHMWKLICKNCPYVCFNINQAKSHILSHKGKKYACKSCSDTFRYPNSLSTHIRLRHSIELVCEFCGCTFASAQGMDCHKRLRHRKEKNDQLGPKCEECNVHFASDLAWKRHRVLCSRHEVSNGCGICGETFSGRDDLKSHLRQHGEPAATAHTRSRKLMVFTPLLCGHCNKELHSRKAYVKHMNTDHPHDTDQTDTEKRLISKCVCEVCGTTFRHHSSLIAHQRKHTDEKPFSCTHCGKKFKNAYAVKMHLPMHTNEYTFKCHLCEKAFGDRGRLNRHVKAHLGIRPYKCSYCDRTFMFQCEERLHTKYVHCKEPYPKRDRKKRTALKREDLK